MMLTNREKRVLDFISDFKKQHDYATTFEEIALGLGLKSKSTAHYYIKSLKEKGYIYIPEGRRKYIDIIKQGSQDYSIPLVGKIAAGSPIEAYEVIEPVDLTEMFNAKERYFLKVSGDSMKDSGIMDGDLVLIQKQHIAQKGQIVVALIDEEEATLKEFRMHSSTEVALVPHNADMETMIYPANRISIQGIYLGLRFDRAYC